MLSILSVFSSAEAISRVYLQALEQFLDLLSWKSYMQLPNMTSQDKNKHNSLQWLVERTPLLLSGSQGGSSRGRRRWMKKKEREERAAGGG